MANKAPKTSKAGSAKPVCGIVMPLSELDGCAEAHWTDVREILTDTIEAAGFEPHLVSDADDVGIIQKRIIQNVYSNPILVCDVSGKNPNVMFELGLRLAFDKPTVIVKDDKTSYSFDTAQIEHLEYPRDLRFARIVEFKGLLADKIRGTHKRATEDSSYTTFLKHFGQFSVAKLDTKSVSGEEYILEEIRSLRSLLLQRDRVVNRGAAIADVNALCLHGASASPAVILSTLAPIAPPMSARRLGPSHVHVLFDVTKAVPWDALRDACKPLAKATRLIRHRR